jgi:hypothetical protein
VCGPHVCSGGPCVLDVEQEHAVGEGNWRGLQVRLCTDSMSDGAQGRQQKGGGGRLYVVHMCVWGHVCRMWNRNMP